MGKEGRKEREVGGVDLLRMRSGIWLSELRPRFLRRRPGSGAPSCLACFSSVPCSSYSVLYRGQVSVWQASRGIVSMSVVIALQECEPCLLALTARVIVANTTAREHNSRPSKPNARPGTLPGLAFGCRSFLLAARPTTVSGRSGRRSVNPTM